MLHGHGNAEAIVIPPPMAIQVDFSLMRAFRNASVLRKIKLPLCFPALHQPR